MEETVPTLRVLASVLFLGLPALIGAPWYMKGCLEHRECAQGSVLKSLIAVSGPSPPDEEPEANGGDAAEPEESVEPESPVADLEDSGSEQNLEGLRYTNSRSPIF